MKRQLAVLLAGICLLSSSVYAQKNLGKGLRKLPKVEIPMVNYRAYPLATRVSALLRGKLPALYRLQKIRHNQFFRYLEQQGMDQLPSGDALARQQLAEKGFIRSRIVSKYSYKKAISFDGFRWYEEDEMVLAAILAGRPVQVGAGGELKVFLYKDGPWLNFYDEEMFKELDRSRALGFELVERKGYVLVRLPKEFENTLVVQKILMKTYKPISLKQLDLYDFVPYFGRTYREHPLFTPWEENDSRVGGVAVSKIQNGYVDEYCTFSPSIKILNDWYEGFASLAKQIKPYEGKLNLSVFFQCNEEGLTFRIQDSRGILYSPEEIDAAVAAERAALLLPAKPMDPPTQLEFDWGDPEEVL